MMARLACFFSMFFLFTFSCNNKKDEITLSEAKLTSVLIDLEYAKAATHGQSRYLKDSMMVVYKEQICQIHKISPLELEKNLEALEDDQELLEKILRNARDSLEF